MRKLNVVQIAIYVILPSVLVRGGVDASRPDASRINVLLITVDDMSCDSVGAFGSKVPGITPNIDKLASEGMCLDRAHVTIAICQPTRAVWMTGRYPHRNGALGFDPISQGVPTMLEALKTAGYRTGILAKVPHVVPTRKHAWDDIVEAKELKTGRDPRLFGEHTQRMIAAAKKASKPFFIMANSQDPHRPFAKSQQETKQGQKKRQGKRFPGVSRTFKPGEVPVPGFLPDLPQVRREIAQYYTSVHRADEIVGAVLEALKREDVESTTLVMFLSDHGMPLPFAKTNCWYHSTRTPWIVRWPGKIKPGSRDGDHLLAGIDLAPTILDAIKVPELDGADGRSFLPVLLGKKQAGRDMVFTQINRTAGKREYPMRAVVTKKHMYIFNAWSNGETVFKNESQAGLTMNAMKKAAKDDPALAARVELFLHRVPEELYDYEADPDALENLVEDPAHRSALKRLRLELASQMKSSGDPQLASFQRRLTTRTTE